MTRLVKVKTEDEFKAADAYQKEVCGGVALIPDMDTIMVLDDNLKILGVLQLGTMQYASLAVDPDGSPRDTHRTWEMLCGIVSAAELKPIMIIHDDSQLYEYAQREMDEHPAGNRMFSMRR